MEILDTMSKIFEAGTKAKEQWELDAIAFKEKYGIMKFE